MRDIIPRLKQAGGAGNRRISAEQDRDVIRILDSKDVGRLLARKAARLAEAEAVVRPILEAVRKRGDRALLEYARKFDGLERKSVRVPERELRAARAKLDARIPRAPSRPPSANIRAYAERQMPREWTAQIAPGLRLGQIVRPLDTVAAYIPAGRYPLPSTLMMTVIPAQVAGVPNICVACPRPVAEIFGTARAAGRRATSFRWAARRPSPPSPSAPRTVPRADRIVGPGNIYVAAAKKLLAGEVGIDFVAGPTEILIIAADGDPRHLAADMLAQAEHDVDASRHPADHVEAAGRGGREGSRAAARRRCRPPPVARQVDRQQLRHRPGAHRWTKPSRSPTASRRST